MSLKLRVGKISIGNASTSIPINAVDEMGSMVYCSTTATSGTNYAQYVKLTSTGAGAEVIGGRTKAVINAASANAHGVHHSLELGTSAGNVTGLGTAIRGNIVLPNRAISAGTYYGMMAEIYAGGNTSALPAGSNACLGINLQPGTAIDLVGNAISFSGTNGDGKMIFTGAPVTLEGSVRILINGAVKYLPYYSTHK